MLSAVDALARNALLVRSSMLRAVDALATNLTIVVFTVVKIAVGEHLALITHVHLGIHGAKKRLARWLLNVITLIMALKGVNIHVPVVFVNEMEVSVAHFVIPFSLIAIGMNISH